MPWENDRSVRFWALSTRQFALVILVLALAGVALAVLATRINQELVALTAAPNDNQQWEMAQVDVELLVLIDTIRAVDMGLGATLDDVRTRFDIFYSRIDANLGRLGTTRAEDLEESAAALYRIKDSLDALVPLIDGSDAELATGLPRLGRDVVAMRPDARAVALDYVRYFAHRSDVQRQSLARLIGRTAGIGMALLVALSFSMIVLIRVFQLSVARARVIAESHERFQNTIFASRDAIIVAGDDGRVVEVNPAAERMFGYSHAAFLGARIADLLVPDHLREAHTSGFRRLVSTGRARSGTPDRVVTSARRASGEEFPVEISLGSATRGAHRIVIGFVRDISDQVRAEKELIAARDDALAAARARSSLLAFMSHEMRTPLNGVLAILDLLRGTRLEPRQREYVDTATRSGEILLHLIADALDVTRLQSDVLVLRAESFDLAGLLDEVATINRPAAGARGDEIRLDLDLPPLNVVGDRNRLRQILINLVGNAIKFTLDGTIGITAHAAQIDDAEALFEIAVTDTGLGIAPDQIEHIFEEFVTVDSSDPRIPRGTGLGLAIARRIAGLMGGTLTATSQPGEGSCFRLCVPMQTVPRPPEAMATPASAGAEAPLPRPGVRILVVEDNATNRLVTGEMLALFGCVVTEAEDGVAGVEKATAERFDLILMDVGMPRLDGIGATRAIRAAAEARSRDVPIVGLTAHALPGVEAELIAAGMQRCLYKPLRIADLRGLLVAMFGADPGGAALPLPDAPGATCPDDAPDDTADGGAADPGAEVLDGETVAELAEMLGAEKLEARLAAYADELAGLAEALAGARAAGDLAAVGRIAHRTAGSSAVFGAGALRAALNRLETACARGDAMAVDGALAALPADLEAVRSAVDELAGDLADGD